MRSARLASLAAAAAVLVAGCDSARPIEQRSAATACERCHGFPPPPGVRAADQAEGHPQSVACFLCHRTTVTFPFQLVENGAHFNGAVDFEPHPMDVYPTHSVEALAPGGLAGCAYCHGPEFQGVGAGSCNDCHATINFADWKTNCTFCHGTRTPGWTPDRQALAAPPEPALRANDFPEYRGIGAHQGHVGTTTFADPIACAECHPPVAGLEHVDGGAAEIAWGTLASTGTTPRYDGTTCSNYCHGATLPRPETRSAPAWSPPSTVACGDCHETNPTTGQHPAVTAAHSFECNVCHGGIYTETQVQKDLHVSGAVDVAPFAGFDAQAGTCATSCHSDGSVRTW